MIGRHSGACLLACLAMGCGSMPEFAVVTLEQGSAERVLRVNDAVIDGSILFEAYAPDFADTTEIFLVDVRMDYLYGSCQYERRHPDVLDMTIERGFPFKLEAGDSRSAQLDFRLADPNLSASCGPPDEIEVNAYYYDSQAYEWLDYEEIQASGRIDLDIDPDVVGPADWSCLDAPDPVDYEPGNSTAMVWVRAFDSGTILPGATVKVCDLMDGDCASPIDEGMTDFTGLWPLAVPMSGPYYFEVSGVSGYVTSLFFEYQLPGEPGFDITLTPFSEVDLQSTLAGLGVAPQVGRGHLALTARDCGGDGAIGVTFGVSGSGITEGYFLDGAPTTGTSETSSDAFALFANVPAQATVVSANLAANDAFIAARSTWVRDGAVTFLATDPAPIGP